MTLRYAHLAERHKRRAAGILEMLYYSMLFNSYEYIFLFVPITFFVYFALNKQKLTIASSSWLVICSFVFYAWWKADYALILLFSIFINFFIGSIITSKNKSLRKYILILGVTINLSILGYYKYYDFFIENINLSFGANVAYIRAVLPLGISFFTFQQITYLVDKYNDKLSEYNFLNYSLFVSFFPQLIAGPIVHHSEMMPQFERKKNKVLNYKNISIGIHLFFIGLAKKVVIADTLSIWANAGFDSNQSLSFFAAWVVSLSYTFQLYFDFSGYTDMARGVALLFNIHIPINFNSPYKSQNIQDFWRRWHITLTRFLRDYIYIPLGGNKSNGTRVYINILLVFLLGGLWHGASWTFIIWGALHGVAMIIHRRWSIGLNRMHRYPSMLITFIFVNLTWIVFRAETMHDVVRIYRGIIGLNGFGTINELITLGDAQGAIGFAYFGMIFALSLIISFFANNSNQIASNYYPNKYNLSLTLFYSFFGIIHLSKITAFLYFNF